MDAAKDNKQSKEVYTIISTYAVHGLFFIDLKRRLLPTLHLDRDNQNTLHKQLHEHLTKKVKNIIYTKATEYKKVSRKTIDEQVNSIINNITTQEQEAIVASLQKTPVKTMVDTIFGNLPIDEKCATTNINKHIVQKYSGSYKLFQDVESNDVKNQSNDIKILAENFIHSFSGSTLPTTEIKHYPSKFYIFATKKNKVGVKYLDPKKKNEENQLIHATTEQLLGSRSSGGEKVSLKELFCLFCLDLWIQLLSPDWSGDLSKSLADIGGNLKSGASKITKSISEISFPFNFTELSTLLSKCIPTTDLVEIYKYWLKTVSYAYALQIESLQLLNYSENNTVKEVIFAYRTEKLEVDYLYKTQKKFSEDLKRFNDIVNQKNKIPYNIDELVKHSINCPTSTTKQTIQYIYRAILSFHRNKFKIIKAIKKLNGEKKKNREYCNYYQSYRSSYEEIKKTFNVANNIGMSFRTVQGLTIVTKILKETQLSDDVREGSIITAINGDTITDANELNKKITNAKEKNNNITITFKVPPPLQIKKTKEGVHYI